MKTTLCLLAAIALVCGCRKQPDASDPTPPQWEYKVVAVENFEHSMEYEAIQEMATNSNAGLRDSRFALKDAGDFEFESDSRVYGLDFDQLGADGWELVSAIPQLETVPGAEYMSGEHINPNDGQMTRDYSPFDNVRTGKIIFIFKRRAAP